MHMEKLPQPNKIQFNAQNAHQKNPQIRRRLRFQLQSFCIRMLKSN